MRKKKSAKGNARNLPAKELTAKQATQVKAGGKKGGGSDKVKFMEYKLDQVFITSVNTGGGTKD